MTIFHRRPLISLVFSTLLVTACGPNQRIINSSRENPPPVDQPGVNVAPAVSTFESDVQAMQTADFYFIYVFRRRDGARLDAEDKKFLSANIPTDINRRRLSDGEKALIAGSNYRIPDEMLDRLKERFAFEDLSRPADQLPANIRNANTSANG
jgi:hypothetical protein